MPSLDASRFKGALSSASVDQRRGGDYAKRDRAAVAAKRARFVAARDESNWSSLYEGGRLLAGAQLAPGFAGDQQAGHPHLPHQSVAEC